MSKRKVNGPGSVFLELISMNRIKSLGHPPISLKSGKKSALKLTSMKKMESLGHPPVSRKSSRSQRWS